MKNIMKYKGYSAKIEYSEPDKCFWGKLLYIYDSISFEGESVEELKEAFKEAVDDYLETCIQLDKKPDKPFKGSFNIRISPELHRKAAVKASSEGRSLNQVVEQAIREAVG